jgi:hypothetical protein
MQAVSVIADNVSGPTGNDDQIRDKILRSFEENDWATVGLGVIVKDGVVHLGGRSPMSGHVKRRSLPRKTCQA